MYTSLNLQDTGRRNWAAHLWTRGPQSNLPFHSSE